jgi:hypothetical protein
MRGTKESWRHIDAPWRKRAKVTVLAARGERFRGPDALVLRSFPAIAFSLRSRALKRKRGVHCATAGAQLR